MYDRLEREKRAGESFTRVIERLLEGKGAITCEAVAEAGARYWSRVLSKDSEAAVERDAVLMESHRLEDRARGEWETEPLQ